MSATPGNPNESSQPQKREHATDDTVVVRFPSRRKHLPPHLAGWQKLDPPQNPTTPAIPAKTEPAPRVQPHRDEETKVVFMPRLKKPVPPDERST